MSETKNKNVRGPNLSSLRKKLQNEQKDAHAGFHAHDINFLIGKAGCGKTFAAVVMALINFRENKKVPKKKKKIMISRPITKNNLGFLPGDVNQKMESWIYPIIHNLVEAQGVEPTENMITEGQIVIKPIDFMKGITIPEGSTLIVDEFQDLTYQEYRLVQSRLGKGAKVIFCGDPEQVDKSIKDPCIPKIRCLKNYPRVSWTELTSHHRHEDLPALFEYLDHHNKQPFEK